MAKNGLRNQLDVIERKRFNELKSLIAKTRDSAWAYYGYILEVRDSSLWREEYRSFDEFCEEWAGIPRRRVNQILEACELRQEVGKILPSLDLNEHQLSALKNVADDELPEVVAKLNEVKEAGEKVTAKVVKQVVAEICEPEPEPEPEPEEDESPVEAGQAAAKPVLAGINDALRELRELPEVPGTELLVGRERAIRSHLENAKSELVSGTPAKVCHKCKGKPDGCTVCGNLGWLVKANG